MTENYILRLLSLLNRNPLSPYFGSFHRDFWHYKMASDFPSSIYQMGVFPLTIIYTQNLSKKFYQNQQIYSCLQAGIKFWASIQNKDGSFNEWFPNEHSIVATAFTTWGISESLLLLPLEKRNEFAKLLEKNFLKTAEFLEKNIDTITLNHTAGALAALYNLYLITGNNYFKNVLLKNKKVLLSHQDQEGWYSEYGEPDIGYQSLSIFFLAQYFQKSGDQEILSSLNKALDFLSCFTHPDGTIGGEYGSRNTKYIFRYGLYLLSAEIPSAKEILNKVNYQKITNIESVDDRYFIFFFLPDFLLMYNKNIPFSPLNQPAKKFVFFDNCGILINETAKYKLIINLKKGGALKIFDKTKGKLLPAALGYAYKIKKYTASSLGFGISTYSIDRKTDQIIIRIRCSFLKYNLVNPLRRLLILFRLFNFSLGHYSLMRKSLNHYLKIKKIKKTPAAKGSLEREIILKENSLEVKNVLRNLDFLSSLKQNLYKFSQLSFRFVPSSHFSCEDELTSSTCEEVPCSATGQIELIENYHFE